MTTTTTPEPEDVGQAQASTDAVLVATEYKAHDIIFQDYRHTRDGLHLTVRSTRLKSAAPGDYLNILNGKGEAVAHARVVQVTHFSGGTPEELVSALPQFWLDVYLASHFRSPEGLLADLRLYYGDDVAKDGLLAIFYDIR